MRHKKFVVPVIIIFSLLIYASCVNAAAFGPEPSPENLPAVHITSVGVTGNSQITSEYILNVADTKPGKVLSRDMIQADIEEIYNQGYFSYVDVDIRPEGGGASVMFNVQENPVIESINFSGNTIYKDEQLMTARILYQECAGRLQRNCL